MESEALATFVAVHRAGGVSHAALQLNRSQPAISRRLAQLEAEIGAPLFDRVGGGLALSQAGVALLPHAERALAAMKDARAAVTALRAGEGGAISLAIVGTLANEKLVALLRQFARAHAKARVALRTASSASVSALVRSGECAIGVRYFPDESGDLECHALKPERLIIACAPDHPRAGKRVASLRALRHEAWLAFPEPARGQDVSSRSIAMEFAKRDVFDLAWTPIDSLTAQKRLIEAGLGLALLPESSIAEERARKSLALIDVRDLDAENPVHAVTRRGGYLSPPARAFLDLLMKRL